MPRARLFSLPRPWSQLSPRSPLVPFFEECHLETKIGMLGVLIATVAGPAHTLIDFSLYPCVPPAQHHRIHSCHHSFISNQETTLIIYRNLLICSTLVTWKVTAELLHRTPVQNTFASESTEFLLVVSVYSKHSPKLLRSTPSPPPAAWSWGSCVTVQVPGCCM